METSALIDAVRIGAGAIVAAIGLFFVIGGAVGMLRFPDVYTRSHAALSSDATGAALVAFGLAIMAGDWAISPRLALLGALLAATGPANAHIVTNAAHSGGLAPISGRYVAPRSGERTQSAPQ